MCKINNILKVTESIFNKLNYVLNAAWRQSSRSNPGSYTAWCKLQGHWERRRICQRRWCPPRRPRSCIPAGRHGVVHQSHPDRCPCGHLSGESIRKF